MSAYGIIMCFLAQLILALYCIMYVYFIYYVMFYIVNRVQNNHSCRVPPFHPLRVASNTRFHWVMMRSTHVLLQPHTLSLSGGERVVLQVATYLYSAYQYIAVHIMLHISYIASTSKHTLHFM